MVKAKYYLVERCSAAGGISARDRSEWKPSLRARRLRQAKRQRSPVCRAVRTTNIRTAFAFFGATTDRIVTYHFMLHDQPVVLSSILGLMARSDVQTY